MSNDYNFTNPYRVADKIIPEADLGSTIQIFSDPDWITLSYSGATMSKWFTFVNNTSLSEVIVGALINRSAGINRYNDNEKAVAAGTTMWVNDNLFNEQGVQVWNNNVINFIQIEIDIVHDAATTPITRTYHIRGSGRISTDAEQPGDIEIEIFRGA